MLRLMVNTLMAMGLVLVIGGGIQAGGKGGSGGQSSHGGTAVGKGGQSGNTKAKAGQVTSKPGQAKGNTGPVKGKGNPKRASAPHRFAGVQPHWHRYWNATYRCYMYADPSCDCSYFWDEKEGCYCLLAEENS